jgi:hypothetical protein
VDRKAPLNGAREPERGSKAKFAGPAMSPIEPAVLMLRRIFR